MHGLTGFAEYASELFDPTTIRRLWRSYEVLLDTVTTAPDSPLPALPLPSTCERHQLAREWNDTARASRPEVTVTQLLEAQARRTPEAVAVVHRHRVLSYQELDRLATRQSRRLRSLGAGPESRVGVLARPSPELAAALLAVWKAGAAYVPLDPDSPRRRLLTLLAGSGAALLLADRQLAQHLPETWSEDRTVWLGEEAGSAADAGPLPALSPDNLAYVLHTSGSTGTPKGVQVSHRALVSLLLAMVEQIAPAPHDVFAALASLSFDIAAVELYLPWILGGRTVLVDREASVDGAALSSLLDTRGATVVQATPAGWKVLMGASWRGGVKAISGGEALSGALAGQLRERSAAAWNLYGPTEATVYATGGRLAAGAVTIGRPVAGARGYLMTRAAEPAPLGAHGELWIGGQGLARGYQDRPGLTAERFVPDSFGTAPGGRAYRSGDLARFLPDGRIDYLGRFDHQVKIRGFRIELGEVESALLRHPAVREAVVVAREHLGEGRLVAYVVAAPSPGLAELREAAAEVLPAYMVPAAYVLLDALPLTPTGKVDRRSLPDPTGQRPALAAQYAAPRTATEALVAELWQEALHVDRVGRDDSFFDLGGHSLLLAQVRAGLQERLRRDVAILEMFRHPTVAALAQYLAAERPESAGEEERDERRQAGADRLRQRRMLAEGRS